MELGTMTEEPKVTTSRIELKKQVDEVVKPVRPKGDEDDD